MIPPDDQAIILWDSDGPAPETGAVLHWNGHATTQGRNSLLSYCEENAESLRDRYCRWIRDLGESSINDVRVVDHLLLDGEFSYWWMTRFVEQSPWKSPAINEAIRLLAMEQILIQRKPKTFILVSANPALDQVLSGLCQRLRIAYDWGRITDRSPRWSCLREVYRSFPQPMQALVSFVRDLVVRWPLKDASRPDWYRGEKSLFVCSYFLYMTPGEAAKGHFSSSYWGGLHSLLARLGIGVNWLQLYREHKMVPAPDTALDWIGRFNRRPHEEGAHAFLDSYLTWGVIFSVLKKWIRLLIVSWRLRGIERAFRPQCSQLSLWPVMRADWYASMRGPDSICNLLSIELFDRALGDFPRQRMGLYLCENQAWERALIKAWRKHGHGHLIAVPHSTQSFWDLRYFQDIGVADSTASRRPPQPDLTAVNGEAALETFLCGRHPRNAIVQCEALRYGYLHGISTRQKSDKVPGEALRVLILGEYLPSGTAKMLKLIESSISEATGSAVFTLKPHPNCPVKASDYPTLKLRVIHDPLKSVMNEFDVALSGSMTSAAVDAYLSGLPVVIALDNSKLNYSPLRGRSGVRFVSTPMELAQALQSIDQWSTNDVKSSEFFFLDPELKRWQEILLTR